MAARERALAAHLVDGGRGVLAVDQPCAELHRFLIDASLPATAQHCHDLRRLVAEAPGLDRLVNGALLTPAALGAARTATVVRRRRPVGVRMTVSDGGAESVAAHRRAGAGFARARLELGGATGRQSRAAACWAAACQHGGLVPLLDCRVTASGSRTDDRRSLAQVEEAHTAALAAVLTELLRAGTDPAACLLGIAPVVPGPRCSQVDASDDVARATVRSLREAGAGGIAGIVVTPPQRHGGLTAHLAALQHLHPEWPIGFCLDAPLLAAVAAVWRGRPDRVTAARDELRNRLVRASGVLRIGRAERPAPTGPPPAGGAGAGVA